MLERMPVIYGVPQGSTPGPLLFDLYTIPLGQILQDCVSPLYHSYKGYTQIDLTLSPSNYNPLESLRESLKRITNWTKLSGSE